jgi:hypothetical protein
MSDMLEYVVATLERSGLAIPVLVGHHYVKTIGTPPRVVFDPETPSGRLKSAIASGNVAAWSSGCDVYVSAKPGPGDIRRFDFAVALADIVIGAIAIAGSGRIDWGSIGDASMSGVDCPAGVALKFSFGFTRDVSHCEQLWGQPGLLEAPTKLRKSPMDLAHYSLPEFVRELNYELSNGIEIDPTTEPKD